MKKIKTLIAAIALLAIASCQNASVIDKELTLPKEIDFSSDNLAQLDEHISNATTQVHLDLYNKWGEQVYTSESNGNIFQDIQNNWDKIDAESEVLMYALKATPTYSDTEIVKKGMLRKG